jgi:hypothetical protein
MRILATIALVTAAAPAAHAADSFFAAYIAERGGAAPCYARTYDAKHLAAHPKQKVVHFFVTRSDVDQGKPPKTFDVSFGFRLKDSTDAFSSLAGCAAKGDGATCSVEGDGGHFRLTPRPDGFLVTVVDYLAIEGMESFSPDLAESDDRDLRLYASPASECGYHRARDDSGDDGGGAAIEPLTPSISRPQ